MVTPNDVVTEVVDRPLHSPLGASSAERWLNCPGSVALIKGLNISEPSDEPDYRREGTAAHEAAAHCLRSKLDAWEIVGQKFYDTVVSVEMADAIQVYLDVCRQLITAKGRILIEFPISAQDVHPQFYGTVDFAHLDTEELTLDVVDFKYGMGVLVEVERNPQLSYYAFGVLCNAPEARRVRLHLVQPRGFHGDGTVRVWETTAEEISTWAHETLVPAMHAAELDHSLDAGDWCRFCPAKLVCPLMTSLFGAAATAPSAAIVDMSDEALGRNYPLVAAVKHYLKALEERVFDQLSHGHAVPGTKLVWKKANRVFKEGALEIFLGRYKESAMTTPEMKSPAEMEKLDANAKSLVREWSYTPQNGLTVALESDRRVGVKVQSAQEAYGHLANGQSPAGAEGV